jgi:large subunit ribosomal protein L17
VDATPLARPARRTALAAAPAQDDLKVIEGIGPKIASVLNAAGITTYRQLAETDAARLSALLDEAGVRAPADPTTWPEQARLAADGDWDAFKRLTEELKAGRRVESAKEQ